MSFTELNLSPDVFKAIHACGYTKPTPIQQRSIPDILNGKDLVASAQTGTGKTAAFVLPALHKLSLAKASNNKPRVLILTPTRELATQIMQAVNKYGKFLQLKCINLVGGMPYGQQIRDLSRAVDIVIATPGRLLDHMENRRLDLSNIEMLILDEADRMLDMGFINDVTEIARETPKNRQTLLFSATIENNLKNIIRQLLKNPVYIDLSHEVVTPTQIKQEVLMADNIQHKMRLLQHYLDNENIFKAIIFTGTKIHADHLAGQLSKQGYSTAALHGDLRQNIRNKTIERFSRGNVQFLIATDVAARGINISDITHVFNFDIPKFSEDYVHRIGRTGRAGKTGIAVSFILPAEHRHLQKIERYISQQIKQITIPGLEPTKRASSPAAKSSKPGKKRHRFSNNDNRSGYGSKSDGPRKHRSNDCSSFRSKSDRPRKPRSNDDSGFGAKFDRPRKPRSSDDSGFSAKFDRPKKTRSNDDSGFGAKFDRPRKPRSNDDSGFGAKFDRPRKPRSNDGSGFGSKFDRPRKPKSNDGSGYGSKFDGPRKPRSNDGSDFGSKFGGSRKSKGGSGYGSKFDGPKSSNGAKKHWRKPKKDYAE